MFRQVLWVLWTLTVVNGLDWGFTEQASRLALSGIASPAEPEVATLTDGSVVAGWFDTDTNSLHAMILTDGDPIVRGSTILVHQSNSIVFGIESKELAGIAGGGFVITWIESNELYYREYTSAGVAVTAATRASTFMMGGHGVTKHSVIGYGSGAVMFFADTVGNSFYKTGDMYAVEVAPLHGMGGELVMDIVEMQSGIAVFYSDATDIKFTIYDSSFGLITAPTIVIGAITITRVEVGSTKYGRDVPLITVAAHDAMGTNYLTWKFTDDLTSDTPVTFTDSTIGSAHVTLAVGDSSTYGGQIILFDYDGDFSYRTTDGYTDLSSSFNTRATVGLSVTSLSAAQLGANGWIVVFNEQKQISETETEDGVSITYYRAPEKQFTLSWDLASVDATVIPTGGYCVTGLNSGSGEVAVFGDDHQLIATYVLGAATDVPRLAGCIGNTATCIIIHYDGANLQRTRMDMTTGVNDVATVSTASDYRAKVCGIDDLVILTSVPEDGSLTVTAYFGIDTPTSRDILFNSPDYSPFDYQFSCRETDYLLAYMSNSARLTTMVFDASTNQAADSIGGPTVSSIADVFTFPEGDSLVFAIVSSTELYSYSFAKDSWMDLTHNLGFTEITSFSMSKSLEDNTFHISFRAASSSEKDDSEYAIGYVKYDRYGTDIQRVVIANNFVIGNQFGTVLETYSGPVLAYVSGTGVANTNPAAFILPMDVASSFTKTDEVLTNQIMGIQTSPKSCGVGDGSVVVVWSSSSGSHSSVYAQIYEPSGAAKFSQEFMVNTAITTSHVLPSVACYDSGFFVAWESQVAAGSSVYVQQFDAAGARIGSEVLISTQSAGEEARASIATTSTGDQYVVAWHGDLGLGDNADVYVRFMDPALMVNPDPVLANTVVTSVQKDASVDIRDDYSVIVVWQSNFQDGSRYGIYSREYLPDHSAVAMAELQVHTDTLGSQSHAHVKYFSDGKHIVTWASRHTGSAHAYAAVFLSSAKVVDDFRINSNDNGNHRPSSLCVFSDDSFIVGWNYYFSETEQDAYLRRFGSDMLPRTVDVKVNTYTHRRQYDPSVAVLNTNSYLVSWASRWQDGSGWSIYSTMFVKNATLEAVSMPDSGGTGTQAILRSMSDGSVVGLHLVCDEGCDPYASYTSIDGVTSTTLFPTILSVMDSATFDMQVVGNTMYLFLHDDDFGSLDLYSISITNGVFGTPDKIFNFDSSTLRSHFLFPSITVSGNDIAIIWKDTTFTIGDNLIMQVYNIPGDSAVSYNLFPSMINFPSGHSLATLTSGYLAVSNSMAFSGSDGGKPYLSVVDLSGVVLATVSLSSEESHYITAVTALDNDMVAVCYAVGLDYITFAPLPIYCGTYQVTFIGSDAFITKVGDTVDTVLYGYAQPGESEGFSVSTVSNNRFAIAGRDVLTGLVHLKVFTATMELDEAYTLQDSRNTQGLGIAVAQFQDSGLLVSMYATSDSEALCRTMFWKQRSTIVNNFDTTVPTTSYEFAGEGVEIPDEIPE